MKRPDSWVELPYRIKESVIERVCHFDYDSYESSLDEVKAMVLNGYYDTYSWHVNYNAMQRAYRSISDEQLIELFQSVINGLREQADCLQQYLDESN